MKKNINLRDLKRRHIEYSIGDPKNGFWITNTKEIYRPSEMNKNHIESCIKMLSNNYNKADARWQEKAREWLDIFDLELNNRLHGIQSHEN